jgi:hypothetical protein
MYRVAADLTATLDDLQAHVVNALRIDPNPAAVNASGDILERMQRAKTLCQTICDTTLRDSPLAAMTSPKKSKGVHDFVKAAYTPSPPRLEDEQVNTTSTTLLIRHERECHIPHKTSSRSGRRRQPSSLCSCRPGNTFTGTPLACTCVDASLPHRPAHASFPP